MLRCVPLLVVALLALALGAPPAPAADAVIVADPGAREVTALDGTVVWVTQTAAGTQRLMRRDAAGDAPVPGAPAAPFYRGLDLGHSGTGKLVLTYARCSTPSRCTILRDDLAGHRASFRGLTLTSCSLSTTPALWGPRAAYGLFCRRGSRADERRSGLYVKTATGRPRRMPRARDVAKYHVTSVSSVDLRGTRVAAVYSDIYSYATVQSVSGHGTIGSTMTGASEGDGDARTPGLSLGAGGALWALTDAEHAGDPLQTLIYRLRGPCREYDVQETPEAAGIYAATDLAVDGTTVYLVAPGVGITGHAFAPVRTC